jgi:hypothetical protein
MPLGPRALHPGVTDPDELGTVMLRLRGSFYGVVRPLTAVAAVTDQALSQADVFERARRQNHFEYLKVDRLLSASLDSVLIGTFMRIIDAKYIRSPARDELVADAITRLPSTKSDLMWEMAFAASESKMPRRAVEAFLTQHAPEPLRAVLSVLASGADVKQWRSGGRLYPV